MLSPENFKAHLEKMEFIKPIGVCLILGHDDENISSRISEEVFKSLLRDYLISTSGFTVNEIRFTLYVYSRFLQDKYIKEISEYFKETKNYKFWVPTVYWRKDPSLSDLTEEEQQSYLKKYPEHSGRFESLEWRLRINNKFTKGVKYITPKTNCLDNKTLEYKFNKIFTDEYDFQKEIILKYENIFKRIRVIKKYLTEISKNCLYINSNLNLILN